MTIEAAKRGYAFATVRPRGDRNFQTKTINLAFVVEEGTRAYIERINIRGNTRTRDYVIRREFDIGEGDAYNRALIDRAERRLKNLDYFKTVKITNEPGSAPDRVVVNVDVEEKSTGEFSISGGYSTADGFIAEVSVAERNLHGPRPVRQGVGQLRPVCARLSICRSSSRICSATAWPAASTCSAKQDSAPTHTCPTTRKTVGANLRLGFALTRRTGVPAALFDLPAGDHAAGLSATTVSLSTNAFVNAGPASIRRIDAPCMDAGADDCYADGEASLAVRMELANGPVVDVARRLYADLQHARQQQDPDQRPLRRTQAGLRRRRRRREFHPHDRRCSQLLRGAPGRRRRAALARRPS